MADAYQIPIDSPGLDKLLDKISKVADGIGDISKKVKGLGEDAASAKSRASAGSAARRVGPFQQLGAAKTYLAELEGQGLARDDPVLMDAQFKVAYTQKRVANAQQVISGTTANISRNPMSLLSAIPAFAEAAVPFAAAAGLGMETLRFADAGMAKQRAFNQAFWIGGGSPRETTANAGLGSALGMSPQDVANNAVSLGQSLRNGDSVGAAILRGRGMVDLGFFTPDKQKNYAKAIDYLTSNQVTDSQATAIARDVGLTNILELRDIRRFAPSQFEQLQKMQASAADPQNRAADARYQANKSVLSNQWDSFHRTWAQNLPFLSGDKGLGNSFQKMMTTGLLGPTSGPFANAGLEWVEDRITGYDPMKQSKAGNAPSGPGDPRMGPIRMPKQEQIGGGERAAGAVPAGWRYQQMEEALKGQSQMLGGFNI